MAVKSPHLLQQIQLAESEHDLAQFELTVKQEKKPDNSQIKTLESNDSYTQISYSDFRLLWESRNYCFRYNFTALLQFAKETIPSKRAWLRITVKIFDPLGFLSPFVI